MWVKIITMMLFILNNPVGTAKLLLLFFFCVFFLTVSTAPIEKKPEKLTKNKKRRLKLKQKKQIALLEKQEQQLMELEKERHSRLSGTIIGIRIPWD